MDKQIGFLSICSVLAFFPNQSVAQKNQPNIMIIYTDDQRWDALGASGNEVIQTPTMDSLVKSGMYFPNSFVTLSICTPSRAAFLTGKYGSRSDVMSQDLNTVNPDIKTVAHYFKKEGYNTSVFGKWHISNSPQSMGFEYEYYFQGLVPFWDVPFIQNGVEVKTFGFIEDVIAEGAIEYLKEVNNNSDKPFFMWFNTWAPHMDKDFSWPSKGRTLSKYPIESMLLPTNWPADFTDKPPYIKHKRPYQRALEYGYSRAYPLQHHIRGYYAATTDMDAALGNLIATMSEMGLLENTFILLMGDNGWLMGEHGLTSKVLAYEESIRVPLIAVGPGINPGISDELMLNIDLMPTVLDLANIEVPFNLHGNSFKHLLGFEKNKYSTWREYVFYEAPISVHGTKPHYAIRTKEWKLIQTFDENEPDKLIFEELYDIKKDPDEKHNLVLDNTKEPILESLRKIIEDNISWSNENRFNR